MNLEFAFSSKHPHVPKTERWLASISDGRTIFQDKSPNKPSAWIRLRNLINDTSIRITNIRLEAYGHKIISVPHRHPETGDTQVDGYWYSNKVGVITHLTKGGQVNFVGVGYVHNSSIYITWVREDGQVLNEVRPLYRPDGSIEPGAILQ